MSVQIQVITLDTQQKEYLESMQRKGRWTPRQLKRAQILLQANDQKMASNSAIAASLTVGRETVRQVRHRFKTKGLKAALFDRPRTGQPRKLTDKDEANIIATACSDPPKGCDHWTLKLLKQKLKSVRHKEVSTTPIRKVLLQNKLKPWLKKNVVHTGDKRRV